LKTKVTRSVGTNAKAVEELASRIPFAVFSSFGL
jgi:hypothetical protein